MKIYSWNMLFRNRELDRAFQFISETDFDIFCLQEVPEEFLKRLQTLSCFIAFRTERELLYKKGLLHNYIVILSKHIITSDGEIPHPDYLSLLPLRTRLFMQFMPFELFARVRDRRSLCVDITVHGVSMQVFNLHLILAQPAWRLREFETAMTKRDTSRPTIVCGDFNILESPKISILNWLLSGHMSDALLWTRERNRIEKYFATHGLTNPLHGKNTHPLSRSQLDHILVSHSFSIKNAEVLTDRIGSDHRLIRVEVA